MITHYNMSHFELSDNSKWSGRQPVPAIGQTVTVTMNKLGDGIVRGYFIE